MIKRISLTAWILLAMVAGVILGLGAPRIAVQLQFLGDIFLGLLKMVIAPFIMISVISGILNLKTPQNFKNLSFKTAVYFVTTSVMAIGIGLVLVNVFQPGIGVHLNLHEKPTLAPLEPGQFFQLQIRQLLQNPVSALAELNVLAIVFYSALVGLAILKIPGNKPLVVFFEAFQRVYLKILEWIMAAAPLGVLGLIASMVAKTGPGIFVNVGKFVALVFAGSAIHYFVTLPLVLKFWGKVSPIRFFKKTYPAMLLAFSTASSSATLPTSIKVVEKDLKISPRVSRFILPLGTTINMDGTALYEAVAALFVAQAYGIHLDLLQQGIVFLMAMLVSMGAPGIPSAGMVTLMVVLKSVGLPLEMIGLLLAIDRPLDTFRTALNVTGDMTGCVVVNRWSATSKAL